MAINGHAALMGIQEGVKGWKLTIDGGEVKSGLKARF
jgi:hypothetical protein